MQANIDTAHIDPGKPWQNGCYESFNGKFRDECLGVVQKSNRCEDCHRAVPASLQRGSTPLESRPTDPGGVQTATEFNNQPGRGHLLSRNWSEECQQVIFTIYPIHILHHFYGRPNSG
jgi:integrase-like protein